MLMFLLGFLALGGAFLCLLAFGAFTLGDPITFVLMVSFLWGCWKISAKPWGVRAGFDAAEAKRARSQAPRVVPPTHSARTRQAQRYAGLTSMTEWDDEDVPE